jgi:8-oxo-dGTP pyrophosphatase MutT (NUDIX family)
MKRDYSFGIVPLKQEGEGVFILLIFHKGGKHWGFPKGHKDPYETDLETAKRELKEETGLEVESLLSEVPYVESYQFYKFHEKVHKTVAYYPALVSGQLRLQPEEILDAKWLLLQEAVHYLTFKEAKEICYQVSKLLAKSQKKY